MLENVSVLTYYLASSCSLHLLILLVLFYSLADTRVTDTLYKK